MAQDKLTIEQWIERAANTKRSEARSSGPDHSLERDLRQLSVAELVEIRKGLDQVDRAMETEVRNRSATHKRLEDALRNAVDPAF